MQVFAQLSRELPQEMVCPEKIMLGEKGEMVIFGLFYKVRSLDSMVWHGGEGQCARIKQVAGTALGQYCYIIFVNTTIFKI